MATRVHTNVPYEGDDWIAQILDIMGVTYDDPYNQGHPAKVNYTSYLLSLLLDNWGGGGGGGGSSSWWSTAGNDTSTVTRKLGTTSNASVHVTTNNSTIATFYKTGQTGIGLTDADTPGAKLHIYSALETSPISRWQNSVGYSDVFVSDATPEGVITALRGSIAFVDDGTGKAFLKTSGTGNTGWSQFATGTAVSTFSALTDAYSLATADPFTFPMNNSLQTALIPINLLGGNVVSVLAMSATALPAFTYSNGASGVGATMTANANGAFPLINGISIPVGERFGYKDATDDTHNGVWVLNTAGGVSTTWSATRAVDSDATSEVNAQVVIALQGTGAGVANNANKPWTQIVPDPDIGTDSIIYSFQGSTGGGNATRFWSTYGNATTDDIRKLGTTSNRDFLIISNKLTRGKVFKTGEFGWGSSFQYIINSSGQLTKYNNAAPVDGQVLIGDATAGYWKAATLTSGANITITPGAGTISIAAAGGSTPSLTSTQVAFGDVSNAMTSSANLTYATGAINILNAGIGVTSTDGLILKNTTAAAAGAQQMSGRLRFTGQGWKTNATAASQTVDLIHELLPVQDAINPRFFYDLSRQINGGTYTRILRLTSEGGLVAGGSNSVTNFGEYINVIGSTNTVTTTNTPGVTAFIYGNTNTSSNTSSGNLLVGFGNNSAFGDLVFGTSNTHTTGSVSGNLMVGSGNTINGGILSSFIGNSNTGSGGFVYGQSNTVAAGFVWTYVVGASNNANYGSYVFGRSNTIHATGSDVTDHTWVIGSGMTLTRTNVNEGTINFGTDTTTGNKPGMQYKGYGLNQLTLGTDVTQTGYDIASSNTLFVHNSTILTGGTATVTNSGGTAIFTLTITGVHTGQKVVTTGFSNGGYNGTFYLREFTQGVSFTLHTTQAGAIANIGVVAHIGNDSGTVTPQLRVVETVPADVAALYVADNSAGNASLFSLTEAGLRGLVGLIETKITTGDPTGYEGRMVINTFDNTFKIYADAGWRTLASGW